MFCSRAVNNSAARALHVQVVGIDLNFYRRLHAEQGRAAEGERDFGILLQTRFGCGRWSRASAALSFLSLHHDVKLRDVFFF